MTASMTVRIGDEETTMDDPTPHFHTEWPTIRDQVSDQEWQARLDLAACYRSVDAFGMTDLIYNHITSRIPGT